MELTIVKEIPESLQVGYKAFLLSNQNTLFYQSPNYHEHLKSHLDCESIYFIWRDNESIKAVFPFLIKRNAKYGTVFNSLPYYGSNGGFTFASDLADNEKIDIQKEFTEKVSETYKAENAVLSTIVINPFEPKQSDWLLANFGHDRTDSRIGQITNLPKQGDEFEENLLASFSDPRPRNIRRAKKAGIRVEVKHDIDSLKFLFDVHKDNIESIGGKAKKWSFFESIPNFYDKDEFAVLIAFQDDKPIAGLLLFFFNRTVEYFTPATIHEYRNDQPSALLIFEGMKFAVERNYEHWNWGGTWKSQTGVYDFKKRWGAEDREYFYYINILDPNILEIPLEELSKTYPNFYLYPY